MQLAQPAASVPSAPIPPGDAAQPAAAQPRMRSAAQPQPTTPGASTAALTRTQQLTLADAAIADVRAIAAHGEHLVEALADVANSTPQRLQQQVTHSRLLHNRAQLCMWQC